MILPPEQRRKGVKPLRTVEIDIKPLLLDPSQVARHDPEHVRLMGLNILANGLLHAVSTTEDWRLIAGTGRVLAARSAGIQKVLANIYPASLAEADFYLIRASENLHRTDWSAHQKWLECERLLAGNPEWRLQDLAEFLNLTPSAVTRIMAPSKCIEAVRQALRDHPEKIGMSDVYAISKLPEQDQAELLALKLSDGLSRNDLESAGRKRRSGTIDGVKLARVKIALPGGAEVQVCGEALSLFDVVQKLADSLKEARKAADAGYDAKTFQRMMVDKSKAC